MRFCNSPPRDLPLGDRIISHTLHIRLLTTRTTRQSLITAILPEPTPITRTHIPKTATLSSLASPSSSSSTSHRSINTHFRHTPRAASLRSTTLRWTMSRALVRIATPGRRSRVRRGRRPGIHAHHLTPPCGVQCSCARTGEVEIAMRKMRFPIGRKALCQLLYLLSARRRDHPVLCLLSFVCAYRSTSCLYKFVLVNRRFASYFFFPRMRNVLEVRRNDGLLCGPRR